MPLLLDKILSQFAFPLGAGIGLLLLAVLGLLLRRRGFGQLLLGLAILWLWVWSMPLVEERITASLTERHPPTPVAALPRVDAIVVLGGGMTPARGDRGYPDLDEAADRFWHAARLYHRERAPRIIVSGGNVWAAEGGTEADAAIGFLTDLGVPRDAILREGRSRNTRDNAVYSAELLGSVEARHILLVTSATHMHRALAAFRRAGIHATPAATDYPMPDARPLALRLLPDAEALAASTRSLKEYLGFWVYRLRGWA
jgi:uncharacterized SAM-binding protein YcdF (DUF218 family)